MPVKYWRVYTPTVKIEAFFIIKFVVTEKSTFRITDAKTFLEVLNVAVGCSCIVTYYCCVLLTTSYSDPELYKIKGFVRVSVFSSWKFHFTSLRGLHHTFTPTLMRELCWLRSTNVILSTLRVVHLEFIPVSNMQNAPFAANARL